MPEPCRIFLDTEFTGLHQKTTLISLALVAETGEEFYAEFTDYDKSQVDEWVGANVLTKLWGSDKAEREKHPAVVYAFGDREKITGEIKAWLQQFPFIEIWADVLAYDWVLFCELFGGALKLPENIFYIPFDLATVFRQKGWIEPRNKYEKDVNRFEFAEADARNQHHALWDAKVELKCFQLLCKQKLL